MIGATAPLGLARYSGVREDTCLMLCEGDCSRPRGLAAFISLAMQAWRVQELRSCISNALIRTCLLKYDALSVQILLRRAASSLRSANSSVANRGREVARCIGGRVSAYCAVFLNVAITLSCTAVIQTGTRRSDHGVRTDRSVWVKSVVSRKRGLDVVS
jgi:hypothetical protein